MSKTTVFVFCVFLSCFAYAADFDLNSILKRIPERERINFIKHHVNIGYELTQHKPDKVVRPAIAISHDLPEEFSIQLYNAALKNHQVTDENMLKTLKNVICFPNGQCIDVGDVGVHPFRRI